MKLSQVGLQIALVILVVALYEAVRIEVRPESPPGPRRDRTGDVPGDRPDLSGRLAELERRVTELARDRETTPRQSPDGDSEPAGVSSLCAPERWQPGGTDQHGQPVFDPRDLAWFAAMKSEVERRERQERAANLIRAELDRIDEKLTKWQRAEVVRLTLELRRDVRDLLLRSFSGVDARNKRGARLDELRGDFGRTLRGVVSCTAAEAIADRLGRYPGAASR